MDATRTDNKEIIRRLVEADNNRDTRATLKYFGSTLTSHSLFDSTDPITGEKLGFEHEFKSEDFEKYDVQEREMFPEQHTDIDEIFDVGSDMVLSVTTTTRTHKSGKKITTKSMSIDRIKDGKIVETWGLWDRLGYWQQLGLVPQTRDLLAQLDKM